MGIFKMPWRWAAVVPLLWCAQAHVLAATAPPVADALSGNALRRARRPLHGHRLTDQRAHETQQPTDYLYPASAEANHTGAMPACPPAQATCNVLVVVDMQKDYCKGCGSATESKWASEGVKALVGPINRIIGESAEGFEVVVFTQDWLDKGSAFLVHDTVGSQLLDGITQPAGKSFHFTKTADDWMNHGYFHGRLYAIKGEAGHGIGKPSSLDTILWSNGYSPEKTHLYVVGTATYRCVMKGSVHARALGYTVSFVEDAVDGDGNEYDWQRFGDPCNSRAVHPSCHSYMGIEDVGTACSENDKRLWAESIYTALGGPDRRLRQSIMGHAQIRRCEDADAVFASLNGKSCPVQPVPVAGTGTLAACDSGNNK